MKTQNTYLVFNEQEQRWVSKHYAEDLKKSQERFEKRYGKAKINALQASLNRGL